MISLSMIFGYLYRHIKMTLYGSPAMRLCLWLLLHCALAAAQCIVIGPVCVFVCVCVCVCVFVCGFVCVFVGLLPR